MSGFRVYFYHGETRQEMTDYEGNGKTWLSTGGNVRNKLGQFVRGTAAEVGFCSYASMSKVSGAKRVTAADFDHPVLFKMWTPRDQGEGSIEWRKLVAPDAFANSTVRHTFKPGSREAREAEKEKQ
jgi:hypothetical protein